MLAIVINNGRPVGRVSVVSSGSLFSAFICIYDMCFRIGAYKVTNIAVNKNAYVWIGWELWVKCWKYQQKKLGNGINMEADFL